MFDSVQPTIQPIYPFQRNNDRVYYTTKKYNLRDWQRGTFKNTICDLKRRGWAELPVENKLEERTQNPVGFKK